MTKLYKILFLPFFIISLANAKVCTDNIPSSPSTYTEMQKQLELKSRFLSNHKEIATEADKFLSTLLSAKSPLITQWIKKRGYNPEKDETKIIKQWRRYYFESSFINQYPSKNDSTNKLVEDFFSEMANIAFTKKEVKRFNSIFSQAQLSAIDWVKKSKIPKREKELTLKRIQSIKLYWFSSLKGSKYERIPIEFIKWGIAYDPLPNEINIGLEALAYTNDATIFSVFAHEIGHSIDPCRWHAYIKGAYPFKSVVKCLRGPKSAGALKRDDTILDKLVSMKKIPLELANKIKANPTCNKKIYPPAGYQKDQMPEAFADWFSAEILAHNGSFLKKGLREDLCQNTKLIIGSSYLSNQDRLEKIYLANPSIKDALKEDSASTYCNL